MTRFGRLDILVNNAAVRDVTTIDDIDLATWRYVTGIILDGAFICTKACLLALRESGAGGHRQPEWVARKRWPTPGWPPLGPSGDFRPRGCMDGAWRAAKSGQP